MSRTVEFTILSAENLQVNKRHIKGNAFVTVQSDASSDVATTKVDNNSSSEGYPSWNEKVAVEVPLHARFITIEVKCKTSLSFIGSISNNSSVVGIARVPVSDFVGGYVPENQLHFLSYRLWDSKVRRNGVINISVRVKASQHSNSNCSGSMTGVPVTGVPVAAGTNCSTGVVTGIPAVWLNYQRNI